MPLIFPSNTLSAGGFSVDNSLRWNDGDSPYLSRVNGTPTNADKWTFSIWVKRGALGSEQKLIAVEGDSLNNDAISFDSSDQLRWYGITSSSTYMDVKTNRVFRDPSAWMHLCFIYDSGQGTDSDRAKIYVNGTQETSFATETYPDQDEDSYINKASKTTIIGRQSWAASGYFDGYMAEVTFCDGQAYAPDGNFGEFNEDTPTVFQPIDVSGLTFGTNGFYLDFEDSANLGNDANGGTDFTEFNLAAIDQCTDSPTNNFAVANPLQANADTTFAEGNTWTRQLSSATAKMYAVSTIGMSAGKWYMEFKNVTNDNDSLYGITTNPNSDRVNNYYPGEQAHSFGFYGSDGNKYTGGSGSSYGSAASSNDIIGVALDITNENLYFSINGTWQDSGDPTSGATGTGAIDISGIGAGDGFYYFSAGSIDTSNYDNPYYNFGNPAFTISSGNADADGYGNFEYAVPSGYYALCTKNLAEYG